MSITTKTGDQGTTALMYNRRVLKCHPRVEVCGEVDELNANLGLARATARHAFVRENVEAIQKDLIVLMGELATLPEDRVRFVRDGFVALGADRTARLDGLIREIEAQSTTFRGWAIPGSGLNEAALDVARTVCRRTERRLCALQEAGQLQNPEAVIYLNRLGDLLWLLARWVEGQGEG